MAVSRDGEIYSLNRPGSALLAGLPAHAGSAFEDLFDAEFSAAMDGTMQGGVIRINDKAGSSVFMVCRQVGRRSTPIVSSPMPARVRDTYQPDFVCEDAAIQRQVDEVSQAIKLDMPVHILGETGTGKELMARHIHKVSERTGEFVAVNCGAIPDSLVIAELFGYVGGAFTDAHGDGSPGLVRNADNGTLFLDEVADIPLASQTALLRFLDTMEVRPVGGQKTGTVDVQIVSATNADLQENINARSFRSDLLYRLSAYTINLPALAERTDFAAIVHNMIEQLAPGTAITDEALACLTASRWPGNIRQLRSSLQRILMRSKQKGYVDASCLETDYDAAEDCCEACSTSPLSRQRCREIRAAYHANAHNVSKTAEALGLSRTTVYKHLR